MGGKSQQKREVWNRPKAEVTHPVKVWLYWEGNTVERRNMRDGGKGTGEIAGSRLTGGKRKKRQRRGSGRSRKVFLVEH